MPLSPDVAALGCEAQGHDAVHASDLALNRAPDNELLSIATAECRVIVTADLDFPRLLAQMEAAQARAYSAAWRKLQ